MTRREQKVMISWLKQEQEICVVEKRNREHDVLKKGQANTLFDDVLQNWSCHLPDKLCLMRIRGGEGGCDTRCCASDDAIVFSEVSRKY